MKIKDIVRLAALFLQLDVNEEVFKKDADTAFVEAEFNSDKRLKLLKDFACAMVKIAGRISFSISLQRIIFRLKRPKECFRRTARYLTASFRGICSKPWR